ncbi:acyl carrier protein [Allokutzneria oryzae]|uniref:Acyl carrier protein n=1 Tax=Allokutzneria oryzae TaxID=1378989 RepID=A0ABV5ZZ11_9PSEU
MAETQSVTDGVLDILEDVLEIPRADLQAHPTLRDHENWDSMGALEILSQVESRYGVQLDLREFNSAKTVDELAAAVSAGMK